MTSLIQFVMVAMLAFVWLVYGCGMVVCMVYGMVMYGCEYDVLKAWENV